MLSLFQSDNDSLDRCAPHHGRNPYSRVYTYTNSIQIFIDTRGCIPPPRIQQGTHTTVTSRYVQIQGGAYPPRIQQGIHKKHQHLDIYRYKWVQTTPPPYTARGTHTTSTSRYLQIQGGAYPPYRKGYTYTTNIQIFIDTKGCIPPPSYIKKGVRTIPTSRCLYIQGGAYPPPIQQGVQIQHQHLDIYRYKGVHTPPLCNSGYKQNISIQICIYIYAKMLHKYIDKICKKKCKKTLFIYN